MFNFFKDHHVPLNEQQQKQHRYQNIELPNEQTTSTETQNQLPLTTNNHDSFDTNVWVKFN